MLSENLQRDDLSEVEKAEKLHEVHLSTELTLRELAKKLGVSHEYIRQLLEINGYPTEIKQMIKKDEITGYQARPLSQLNSPQEQIKTAEYIRDNDLNYRQAKETVDIIKDLPQPIRQKLTEEPEYTIGQAKEEYVESFEPYLVH